MKPILVIFDGSNFYHCAKRLAPKVHLTNFNYYKLAQTICNHNNPNVEYCVGEIRKERHNPKSVKLYSQQQALFYNLEQQNITIRKGYMLKHNSVYTEKGVDVRIAVDILRGALKDEFSRCFVVSSDTDIIPAITDARKTRKKIIYVGFKDFISHAMRANCTGAYIITKQILNCCQKCQ